MTVDIVSLFGTDVVDDGTVAELKGKVYENRGIIFSDQILFNFDHDNKVTEYECDTQYISNLTVYVAIRPATMYNKEFGERTSPISTNYIETHDAGQLGEKLVAKKSFKAQDTVMWEVPFFIKQVDTQDWNDLGYRGHFVSKIFKKPEDIRTLILSLSDGGDNYMYSTEDEGYVDEYLDQVNPNYDRDRFIKLMRIARVNQQQQTDSKHEHVTFELFRYFSRMNHACFPNCYLKRVFYNDGSFDVEMIAIRDIQQGDDLTYNYRFNSLPLPMQLHDKDSRTCFMQKQGFWKCKCSACDV
jgi:hypothetical protein